MTANWEKRNLTSWGPNVRLDINNPTTTLGGNDIYNIFGVTEKEEDVCLAGLQENGTYRLYNDRTVEIVGGQKQTESGIDVIIQGKNGDICINADRNGRIRIRGKNVSIQADEDIDMVAGRNITLKSGSGRILLKGNTLEQEGLKGNLLPDELQWAWRVFEGTGLPGGAFGSLIGGFGGIGDLAGNLLSNPASFSSLVDGAVSSAISGATGGLVGGNILSNPVGAISGLAGDALSNATGGLLGGDVLSDPLGSVTDAALGQVDGAISDATGGIVKNVTNFVPKPPN